jgi:hypothetical protein
MLNPEGMCSSRSLLRELFWQVESRVCPVQLKQLMMCFTQFGHINRTTRSHVGAASIVV